MRPGRFDFGNRLDHIGRSQKLSVLQVDGKPRPCRCHHQRCLHAQVSRDLDHIRDRGHRRHLLGVMHIGDDGQVEGFADTGQQGETVRQSRAMIMLHRTAVILHERRLENQR